MYNLYLIAPKLGSFSRNIQIHDLLTNCNMQLVFQTHMLWINISMWMCMMFTFDQSDQGKVNLKPKIQINTKQHNLT